LGFQQHQGVAVLSFRKIEQRGKGIDRDIGGLSGKVLKGNEEEEPTSIREVETNLK